MVTILNKLWKILKMRKINLVWTGWEKKSKNRLNWENQKTNDWKSRIMKKNQLNQLEFLKNWPVWFYKLETKNTEPNPNRKKLSRAGLKWFFSKII
jgi:hypothetical protein